MDKIAVGMMGRLMGRGVGRGAAGQSRGLRLLKKLGLYGLLGGVGGAAAYYMSPDGNTPTAQGGSTNFIEPEQTDEEYIQEVEGRRLREMVNQLGGSGMVQMVPQDQLQQRLSDLALGGGPEGF